MPTGTNGTATFPGTTNVTVNKKPTNYTVHVLVPTGTNGTAIYNEPAVPSNEYYENVVNKSKEMIN